MSGEKRKLVGCVSHGSRPKRLKEDVETMRFKIHNFASLVEACDEDIQTSAIQAHGYPWKLCVYPRGHSNSSKDVEYVSVLLQYAGDDKENKPAVQFSVRCNAYEKSTPEIHIFKDTNMNRCYGWGDYLKRNDVLENHLDDDGTLVLDVDLQIAVDKEDTWQDVVWYPAVRAPNDILTQLYESRETTSDVVFGVNGKEFPAHRSILSLRAKTLYELTKDKDNDDGGIVPIQDIEGDTFEQVLEFVYCVQTTPKIKDEAIATKLLLAADRLDCTELKLYVESTITDKFLKAANAAHWLVMSDSHSCALLKEASMKLYASDATTVMESEEDWTKVMESNRLLGELLKFCNVKKIPVAETSSTNNKIKKNIDDVDQLDVTSLREQLLQATLEIDGSREILVDRLKGHYGTTNSETPKAASSP